MNTFNQTSLEILEDLASNGPVGNRWFKVNLHVHGEGNSPDQLIAEARASELDLIAITDHQTFDYFDAIQEAANSLGRDLIVLPGIEITTHEGLHLIAILPATYSAQQRDQLLGWLELSGSGETNIASKRGVHEILLKIEKEERGINVVPHPFTEKIGLLDSARKISTKVDWLESGHIRLFQVSEDTFEKRIRFIERDNAGNWINRYVLKSASDEQVVESTYCLAPFNRSDAHEIEDIAQMVVRGFGWSRRMWKV